MNNFQCDKDNFCELFTVYLIIQEHCMFILSIAVHNNSSRISEIPSTLTPGTMGHDDPPGSGKFVPKLGSLYSLDCQGAQIKYHLGGFTISNGMAWSSDNTTMFFIDTAARSVFAFDYDQQAGTIGKYCKITNKICIWNWRWEWSLNSNLHISPIFDTEYVGTWAYELCASFIVALV